MLGRDTVPGKDFQRKRFYWTTVPPCSDSAMGWTCFSHSPSLVKSNVPKNLFSEGRKGRRIGEERGGGKRREKGMEEGGKEGEREKRREKEKAKGKGKEEEEGRETRREKMRRTVPLEGTYVHPLLHLELCSPPVLEKRTSTNPCGSFPAWDTPHPHGRLAITPMALAQLLWKGKIFSLL